MFYIARITHNYGNGWKTPSGPKYKSRSINDERTAFEAKYDFGFEEWLCANRHKHGDYQYGYVQGVSSTQIKEPAPILLYTLKFEEKKKTGRLIVGVLFDWESISPEKEIPQEIQEQWAKEMRKELQYALKKESSKRKRDSLLKFDEHAKEKMLFNIRYKEFECVIGKNLDASKLTNNNSFTIEKKSVQEYSSEEQKILEDLNLS